jgi:hypothetical protein
MKKVKGAKGKFIASRSFKFCIERNAVRRKIIFAHPSWAVLCNMHNNLAQRGGEQNSVLFLREKVIQKYEWLRAGLASLTIE